MLAAMKGEYGRASSLLREGLSLHAEVGYWAFVPIVLTYLAWGAAGVGRWEVAAQLFGATETVPEGFSPLWMPDLRAFDERVRDELRATLGDRAFAAALHQGRKLTRDGAVAYALELATALAETNASPGR